MFSEVMLPKTGDVQLVPTPVPSNGERIGSNLPENSEKAIALVAGYLQSYVKMKHGTFQTQKCPNHVISASCAW